MNYLFFLRYFQKRRNRKLSTFSKTIYYLSSVLCAKIGNLFRFFSDIIYSFLY